MTGWALSGSSGEAGLLRYHSVRLATAFLLRCYLRVRMEGVERLPASPYVICFNHLGWLDPFVLVALVPGSARLFIFGPRERDMTVGAKNRIIAWSGLAVPFKPGKTELLASARRAVHMLAGRNVLAIAGEGRLSESEHEVLPLNAGAAYLALRAGVPVVPVAINGTRWLRFGKRIRVRVGTPLLIAGRRAETGRGEREAVRALTADLHAQLSELVRDYPDTRVPGPLGRWLTDRFNERPWLDDTAASPPADLIAPRSRTP